MEIVYVFIGKLPYYILETVHQARLFSNDKITLIYDDLESPLLPALQQFNVNLVNYADCIDTDFVEAVNANLKKFCIAPHLGDRKLLFIRSFERFYVLRKYMEKTGAEHILFLELDVLIYFHPGQFFPKLKERDISFSFVSKDAICSGICYVKNAEILKCLTDCFTQYIVTAGPTIFVNEMSALKTFLETPEYKKRSWILPSLWKDTRYSEDLYEHFDLFDQSLFDGAGIAIAMDGPDECHRKQWLENGKVWWGTEVRYNEFSYEWREENGNRVVYAKPSKDSAEAYKVQCLHVHNKNLTVFLSRPCKLNARLLAPSEHPFVQGDRFLKLADLVLRRKDRAEYYEVKDWGSARIQFLEDIPDSWQNPYLLFVETGDALLLLPHLSKFQNQFVLLSHNSDTNVTEEFAPLYTHPKLLHWFTQNLCVQHPKLSFLPIGLANSCWQHGNVQAFASFQDANLPKLNFVYANFLLETNREKREACAQILLEKGIPLVQRSHPFQYWQELAHSVFCISPEGNGVDTHRFWEALYMKTIPVVLRNPLTEQLAKDYPCVLLNRWEDLDQTTLAYDPRIESDELRAKLDFQWFKLKIQALLQMS